MNGDFLIQVIETAGANVLFALIVLAFFGMLLLAILFSGLIIRRIWRWLMVSTWGDAIVFVERKAIGR